MTTLVSVGTSAAGCSSWLRLLASRREEPNSQVLLRGGCVVREHRFGQRQRGDVFLVTIEACGTAVGVAFSRRKSQK